MSFKNQFQWFYIAQNYNNLMMELLLDERIPLELRDEYAHRVNEFIGNIKMEEE